MAGGGIAPRREWAYGHGLAGNLVPGSCTIGFKPLIAKGEKVQNDNPGRQVDWLFDCIHGRGGPEPQTVFVNLAARCVSE